METYMATATNKHLQGKLCSALPFRVDGVGGELELMERTERDKLLRHSSGWVDQLVLGRIPMMERPSLALMRTDRLCVGQSCTSMGKMQNTLKERDGSRGTRAPGQLLKKPVSGTGRWGGGPESQHPGDDKVAVGNKG